MLVMGFWISWCLFVLLFMGFFFLLGLGITHTGAAGTWASWIGVFEPDCWYRFHQEQWVDRYVKLFVFSLSFYLFLILWECQQVKVESARKFLVQKIYWGLCAEELNKPVGCKILLSLTLLICLMVSALVGICDSFFCDQFAAVGVLQERFHLIGAVCMQLALSQIHMSKRSVSLARLYHPLMKIIWSLVLVLEMVGYHPDCQILFE